MSDRPLVHLIGMGGIGMSGLARIYLARGWRVRGSDVKSSEILKRLAEMGADVRVGHDGRHAAGADVVVYSSSIRPDHPELEAARAAGGRVLHRAEALAEICKGKFTIAVTGTHGKTTTTALTGCILREAGRDPSVVVGGLVLSLGSNAIVGEGPEIVIEADESDSSFLKFSPEIEVITNIEEEHMDHFASIADVEGAYRAFVKRLPESGVWFGCADDSRVRTLAALGERRAVLYGFAAAARVRATDVTECPEGQRGATFIAWDGSQRLGEVRLKLMGRHNIQNALAAIAVGLELGVPFDAIARGLGNYEGTARRFDVKYEDGGITVVDDYAHHPTEIRMTLAAARALRPGRLVAVFQPHRYSRTRALLADFGRAFEDADRVLVTDVYAASEEPIPGVSGETVRAVIASNGRETRYVRREDLSEAMRSEIRPGDLFLVMGAGDIQYACLQLADQLKQHAIVRPAPSAGDPFAEVRGRVLHDEPLSRHTSLKVGGPAEHWIEPDDLDDLRAAIAACRRAGLPFTVFAGGSNIVAPDEGIRGAVIHLSAPHFRGLWEDADGTIRARAGVSNALFIQYGVERGFGGFEFLSGIPGHVGGAIAMNAGSHHQSIDGILESAVVVDSEGRARTLQKADIPFAYRSSGLADCVIAEGAFRLPRRPREEVMKRLDEYRDYRMTTQDLRYPSAGCMFKNPADASCSSGKLIDEAGLKGRRIGNAQVSLKHANFIVNLGGASSKDVRELIVEVQRTVKEKFNVDLETEVKLL